MGFSILQSHLHAINSIEQMMGMSVSSTLVECRFELLRTAIWSIAAPNSKVHINRIINLVISTWRLLSDCGDFSDERLRAEIRESMAILEDTGDLVALNRGFWVPATTRTVELPDQLGKLLIGGVPTALLQLSPETLQFHGPHRHITRLPPDLASVVPSDSFSSWVSKPTMSLKDWAIELLDSLERRPYSPLTTDSFEFYLPEFSRRFASQFKRWFVDAKTKTGTILARRRRIYGAKEYRLVNLRSGKITKSCELIDVDVRPLMYAFDLNAKNPVRVKVARSGISSEWIFASELPRAEQRLFAAFGKLTVPEDRPYERRWNFVQRDDMVTNMTRSLGIEISPQPIK